MNFFALARRDDVSISPWFPLLLGFRRWVRTVGYGLIAQRSGAESYLKVREYFAYGVEERFFAHSVAYGKRVYFHGFDCGVRRYANGCVQPREWQSDAVNLMGNQAYFLWEKVKSHLYPLTPVFTPFGVLPNCIKSYSIRHTEVLEIIGFQGLLLFVKALKNVTLCIFAPFRHTLGIRGSRNPLCPRR